MENEAVEPQRSSSDPYRGSQRRKRRKTRPHSSDIYTTEYSGRLAWDLKDPEIASAKQAFYQKLAAVLILDSDGSSLGDCVVLQKTKEKRLIAMSPFWALVDRFPKHMQLPRVEGSFRAMVTAQFSDEQGKETKQIWRPRIHGLQVNVLQDVRYPTGAHEWDRLRELLVSAQDGFGAGNIRLLDEDIDIDRIMAAVKESVQKAREIKTYYDEKLKELRERMGLPVGRQEETRTGAAHLEHAGPEGAGLQNAGPEGAGLQNAGPEGTGLQNAGPEGTGLQNVVPRNVDVLQLHVDSKTFVTTRATLLASPKGSWFCHMISSFPDAHEFYVDRSPAVFEWVLEYLRELRYMTANDDRASVASLPLPTEALALHQLRRECDFYGLPELLELVESKMDDSP